LGDPPGFVKLNRLDGEAGVGAFEYLLLFAAVILGLAISDLAVSLHRLLNAADRVRWDALPLLAAALAFERIVIQWWTWHAADRIAAGLTFAMFLGILVSTVLLFLMAAVALPDETGDEVDLRAYYGRVRRRYWLLFGAQWVTLNLVSTWAQHAIYKARVDLLSPLWLIVPITVALALTPNRLVQALGLLGFMIFYTALLFGQTLA
jgi:hypothetical protein